MSLFDRWRARAQEEIAKRAAQAALEKGKNVVRHAGRRLEEALFGDAEEGGDQERAERTRETEAGRRSEEEEARKKLVAAAERVAERDARAEAERRADEQKAKANEEARAKIEREIDDELEALRRRIRK